ncbi:Uncharacterised protein [Vibrio cholerae]|nr:Uncharacterised protein [Vibrio cholerae]
MASFQAWINWLLSNESNQTADTQRTPREC